VFQATVNLNNWLGQSSDRLRLYGRDLIPKTQLTLVVLSPGVDGTFVRESHTELFTESKILNEGTGLVFSYVGSPSMGHAAIIRVLSTSEDHLCGLFQNAFVHVLFALLDVSDDTP